MIHTHTDQEEVGWDVMMVAGEEGEVNDAEMDQKMTAVGVVVLDAMKTSVCVCVCVCGVLCGDKIESETLTGGGGGGGGIRSGICRI